MKLRKGIPARALIHALLSEGFVHVRTEGSHRRFKHPDGRRVTVSAHKDSDDLPVGTLRKILFQQVRWTEDDLRRLGLSE